MVNAVFYGKDKENKYTIHTDTKIFKNESDAKLYAMAMNWAYSVTAEF